MESDADDDDDDDIYFIYEICIYIVYICWWSDDSTRDFCFTLLYGMEYGTIGSRRGAVFAVYVLVALSSASMLTMISFNVSLWCIRCVWRTTRDICC